MIIAEKRRKQLSIIVQPDSNFLYRNTEAIYACFTESLNKSIDFEE